MKHWDGRDLPDADELRLPQRDRQRLREMFVEPPKTRRGPSPRIHSVVGLALALALLGGLALVLTPSGPVSSKLAR